MSKVESSSKTAISLTDNQNGIFVSRLNNQIYQNQNMFNSSIVSSLARRMDSIDNVTRSIDAIIPSGESTPRAMPVVQDQGRIYAIMSYNSPSHSSVALTRSGSVASSEGGLPHPELLQTLPQAYPHYHRNIQEWIRGIKQESITPKEQSEKDLLILRDIKSNSNQSSVKDLTEQDNISRISSPDRLSIYHMQPFEARPHTAPNPRRRQLI